MISLVVLFSIVLFLLESLVDYGHPWLLGCAGSLPGAARALLCYLLPLRRGHANLLRIVPIITDDPRRESLACYLS